MRSSVGPAEMLSGNASKTTGELEPGACGVCVLKASGCRRVQLSGQNVGGEGKRPAC